LAIAAFALSFSAGLGTGACTAARQVGNDAAATSGAGGAAGGGGGGDPIGPDTKTTLSGTVYDPAGKRPLYNVYVFVPTAPLDPITPGLSATCDPCGARASGAPLIGALTDAKGHFELKGVPVGKDIPVVMQIGKWRRKVTIPEVKKDVANSIEDPSLMRLPRNRKEGDMPKIAVTAGLDYYDCVLVNQIGIDPDEFTGPTGEGRVHAYLGESHATSSSGFDPTSRPFVGGWGEAHKLWADLEAMKRYDIIIDSCEMSAVAQDDFGPAYDHMQSYLDAGGHLFASHFQFVWFSGDSLDMFHGPTMFQGTAQWGDTKNQTPMKINTTLPKGAALDDWTQNVYALSGISPPPQGQVDVDNTNWVGRAQGATSPWIYGGDLNGEYATAYLTFNTPLGAPVDQQCGRAAYYTSHMSSAVSDGDPTFPGLCQNANDPKYIGSQLVLEFLFFDLSTCVGDDNLPPPPPK
jgi:hypothetical protein